MQPAGWNRGFSNTVQNKAIVLFFLSRTWESQHLSSWIPFSWNFASLPVKAIYIITVFLNGIIITLYTQPSSRSLIHTSIYSSIHPFTHVPIYLSTHSHTHLSTHPPTHPFTQPLAHLSTHLPTHPSVCPSICLPTHPLIHSFIPVCSQVSFLWRRHRTLSW